MLKSEFLLSVIVPAFNEEHRIGQTLIAMDKYLSEKKWPVEVLVVNDGSSDGTAKVVEDYARIFKSLRLIDNAQNHGKGYVVRQGMLEAKGALRLFSDADNATPIEELEKLLPFIKKQSVSGKELGSGSFDVVIGSIGLAESKIEKGEALLRVLAGKFGNLLIRVLVLRGIHDTQRGFKLFTAEAAESIFSRMKITRWGFDIEALALARRMGYAIKEAPVRWIHNPKESKVSFASYLRTLLDLLRIRTWLWLNAYHLGKK